MAGEMRSGFVTDIIKVNVGTPILGQNQVSYRVRLLNMILVVLEIVKKPGVFCLEEISGRFRCPELARGLKTALG